MHLFKIKCLYADETVIVGGTHNVYDSAAVTCKEDKWHHPHAGEER